METFIYKGDSVFFVADSSGVSEIFYAPTLGLLMSVQDDLSKKMKIYLAETDSSFEEFASLLYEAHQHRLPMEFDYKSTKSRYFHLALGLTQNCTLRCVYCHADAGSNNTMSEELTLSAILHAINVIKNDDLKGLNVSFAVGGEPTYDFILLKFAISKIKETCIANNIPFVISMTTNGFYDDTVAAYVAENVDNILLSIDGLASVQNMHRPAYGGGETFDTVIRTLDIFYKIKGAVSVRSTVSNFSIDLLKPFIEYLYDRYGSNVSVVLEPLVPLGRGANLKDTGLIIEPDLHKFGEVFWAIYCDSSKRDMKVSTSALKRGRIASGFCGAMFIPSFTVTTHGVVTTCERDSTGENYGYGRYDSNGKTFVVDNAAIEKNRERLELPHKCKTCICLYHCAGDCPDVRNIGYDRCDLNRSLLIQMLSSELQNGRRV